jgi:DNA-binding PadR family transcriptional regulator
MSELPINFNGLDSSVYGPVRLGVLTVLQMDGSLDFTTLKKRLDVADGAIGIHLRKLEDVGYLTCSKSFVGRRPKSVYKITAQGRRALSSYLSAMQQVIDAVKEQT